MVKVAQGERCLTHAFRRLERIRCFADGAIVCSVAASSFVGWCAEAVVRVLGFLFVMLGFQSLMVLTPSMRTPITSTQPVAN